VLAEENGLKNKSVVREFVKWYRKELLKEEKMRGDKIVKTEGIDDFNSPEIDKNLSVSEALELLKRQLKASKLKVEGLETMLDIAETTYKIVIREKSGSKQSKS
ncbi:MAG: hypothetical protein ACJAUH_001259, partial [Saprospiraceae bacterium]